MKTNENANTNNTNTTNTSSKKSSFWKTWGKTIIGLSLVVIMVVAVLVAPTATRNNSSSGTDSIASMLGLDNSNSSESSGTLLDGIMDAAGLTDKMNTEKENAFGLVEEFINKSNDDFLNITGKADSLPADVVTADDYSRWYAEQTQKRASLLQELNQITAERNSLQSQISYLQATGDTETAADYSAKVDALNTRISEINTELSNLGI